MNSSSSLFRMVVVGAMVLLSCGVARGQQLPERKHIRSGNKLYEQQRMADAEKEYRKALKANSASVEGLFNLGDAQFASGAFEAAEESFRKVTELDSGVTDQQRAAAYYNLGNSQFQQQKLQEALSSYKESLKLNPSDLEAKFNYAYTKALLDQQQNQDNQQNQDQNNQDQQQNQDNQDQQQQNDQQQNPNEGQQPEQNPDQGEQPEQPQGDRPKPSEQQGQQPEQGPSKESEQMLNAVQQAENRTREKVDEQQKGVAVGRSGKNW
ncbi:MAG: tetratricopeptide repeat protein [Tidjanibacter sp.]|nr:tetratricopeptide repeat protein [Tidjanibacter sp.]